MDRAPASVGEECCLRVLAEAAAVLALFCDGPWPGGMISAPTWPEVPDRDQRLADGRCGGWHS